MTVSSKNATELRMCAVTLTQAERDERGTEMSQHELDIERLKSERAELSRSIKTHERRRNELGHILEAGTEPRQLLCAWVPDYGRKALELQRPDTFEVVDSRPMTDDDRQVGLLDVEPVRPPRGAKKPKRRTRTA